MSIKKMGFWSVLSIVFGSQIGSGIFMLPSTLAPYGMLGIYGWCFAGIGAILLAIVFAELCSKFPYTGGPHTYVNETFGRIPCFFVGWAYWLVSWISTSVVIISSIAYLNPIFGGNLSPTTNLLLEIALLSVVTSINCRSVKLSGEVEFVLTLLKFIPFAVVPALIIGKFDASNVAMSSNLAGLPYTKLVTMVTVLSLWGFVGLECATTPAGSVQNPSKTIPRAIILGTCAVALIYFVNSAAIMGVIPSKILETSKAPFVDAISVIYGRDVSLLISLIASIVCIGTVNAWVLTSAQISLGLAENKLLPGFFAKINKKGAPYISVLISYFWTIPILMLTKNENICEQVTYIINFSVIVFLIVYLICCAAFLKIMIKERNFPKIIIGIAALAFCVLMISDASLESIAISILFFASGVFFLFSAIKK